MSRRNRKLLDLLKEFLRVLLAYYDLRRGKLLNFILRLLIFLVIFNFICYWLGLLTAYPEEAFGKEGVHYFLIQFPIIFFGALFDILTFFITIFIAKRAFKTTSITSYFAYIGIDLMVTIFTTGWVLFLFSVSGWLVSLIQQHSESLVQRNYIYEHRLVEAISNPSLLKKAKKFQFLKVAIAR